MEAQKLSCVLQPQEFFRDRVAEVASKQRYELDENLEFYLVNLLCDFIVPSKLETLGGELDALETPLALMMKQALEVPPSQQSRIYKYMGDTSLYLGGFFQDSLNRKSFDLEYYIQLGASAYGSVARIMKEQHGDRHFAELYSRLAVTFADLIELVAEVGEPMSQGKAAGNLLALYDRWTRTNSERLRVRLAENGIEAVPISTQQKQ